MTTPEIQHALRTIGAGLWIGAENLRLAAELIVRWPVDYNMAGAHLLTGGGCFGTDRTRINALLVRTDPEVVDCTSLHILCADLDAVVAEANRLLPIVTKARDGMPIVLEALVDDARKLAHLATQVQIRLYEFSSPISAARTALRAPATRPKATATVPTERKAS